MEHEHDRSSFANRGSLFRVSSVMRSSIIGEILDLSVEERESYIDCNGTALSTPTDKKGLRSMDVAEGNQFDTGLMIACIVYTCAAASEYWLFSWLNFWYGVKLPVFAAMLQNASWPIQGIMYLRQKKIYENTSHKNRVVTPQMYHNYVILGSLNAIITLTRTFGLSVLPPTIYVIVANTEIVFEALMTRLYLRRKVSSFQIGAVALVLMGVFISLYNPHSGMYGNAQSTSRNQLVLGLLVSFASRMTSSLNTILADRFLGIDRKTHLGVLECSFFNAVIPCLLLPLVLTVLPEYHQWDKLLKPTNAATVGVLLLCCTICFAKYADRLSKFSVVSKASTMFFAIMDSNMKLVAGVGTIIFFRGHMNWAQGIGFFLIFCSLITAVYDKKLKVDAAKVKEAEHDSNKL